MTPQDNFYLWLATAPLNEVETEYKRIMALIARRRRQAQEAPILRAHDVVLESRAVEKE